jgi:curli biogenesis system outer membrane secretion channel CsgG
MFNHRIASVHFLVFLILCAFVFGCTQKRYTTTFTPAAQQAPETLDMNYMGPRANIAVGDFTVKARGATNYIGDGLREMMESALFESLRFNVLDRLDPQGLKAEQQLSYSKMAKRDSRKLGAQMEVAELMIYGTVSEFESDAMGAGISASAPKVPVTTSASGKNAHMAIDVRVVDVASGRVIAAKRVAGSAASYKASAGTVFGTGEGPIPVSLGAYTNTPMELAIRDCIYRSVIYACHAVPPAYFRH